MGRGWNEVVAARLLSSSVALLGGCHETPADDRDPGEIIEVVSDLPNANHGGHVGDGECAQSILCVVGPSEGPTTVETATDLAMLAGVRCIAGSLNITAPGVVDLADLASLEVVCGQIRVAGNPDLVDTAGLVSLDTGTRIEITDNPRLERVTVPDGYVGSLTLERNPSLQSLAELEALTTFDIFVSQCDGMQSLALPNLDSGRVFIRENAILDTIDLSGLVTGRVTVSANPQLTDLRLPALRDAEKIEIVDSPALTLVEAPLLEQLDGLVVEGASGFTAIPALGSVTEIGGVRMQDNASVNDVSWLLSLTRIGVLRLLRNTALDQTVAENVAATVAEASKVGGNAGWSVPTECPFTNDLECDEVACSNGTLLCAQGSDADDCCPQGCSIDCPIPDG